MRVVARPPAPGRSLAERLPAVAATWDAEANGELTPADVAVQSTVSVFWRCQAGHAWAETVAQRTAPAGWKNGNPAACRLCTGYLVEVVCACGHTATVRAMVACPDRLCPDCWAVVQAERDAAFKARRAAYEENRDEIKAQARADARAQAEVLWAERGLDRLPDVLRELGRHQLVSALTFSLIGERAFGRPAEAKIAACVTELESLVAGSLPAGDGGPLELFGEGWWAPGLVGTGETWASAEPDTVAALSEVARAALSLQFPHDDVLAFEARVIEAYDDDPDNRTTLTWLITDALRSWAYQQGWRPYRELRVPVGDGRAHGRFDLVCYRTGRADLVIEIDSADHDRSTPKLELARDRGALPVWIRWRDGSARSLPGVHVVDLTRRAAPARRDG